MLANGRAPRHTSVQPARTKPRLRKTVVEGLPISGRKPRKEVRYPDDLDASERHQPEQVIISRHDGLRLGADGAFEHAVVVGISGGSAGKTVAEAAQLVQQNDLGQLRQEYVDHALHPQDGLHRVPDVTDFRQAPVDGRWNADVRARRDNAVDHDRRDRSSLA